MGAWGPGDKSSLGESERWPQHHLAVEQSPREALSLPFQTAQPGLRATEGALLLFFYDANLKTRGGFQPFVFCHVFITLKDLTG